LTPLGKISVIFSRKKWLPAFHHSDKRHLENASHFLDAGIRQMPAGAQKQPLVSKLTVAVSYAPSGAYLIAFAITR
jgi:hypothetical protein